MLNKNIVPGLGLSFAVALMSYVLNLFVFKGLGAATIAILLGIVLGNIYFKQPILFAGTAWSEKKLLEFSVMFLGATVTFQTIKELGWKGMSFILLQMVLTIVFVMFIGKKLGFSSKVNALMASGNAVCGSSAIAAVEPVIGAEDKDKRTAITMVNLMGTFLMLLLPILGTWLLGENDFLRGALIGGTIQSVGQVVASATMVNLGTTTMATLFKIMRIIMLVFVVLYFSYQVRQSEGGLKQQAEEHLKIKRQAFLPWYVLGFVIFCSLDTILQFPRFITEAARFISSWCEVIALAAIGLRLNLVEFIRAGRKLAIYGLVVLLFQVGVALILIRLLLA
ncbi:MAG TPA: putative sulfate exporter family transporter [Lactococcus sp.]|uniref:YeiH family protein n=1 Tax=Lactococcus muris TaxID=2941330 RepID=A0ABV4D6H6_9LACT|nr:MULTISPECIES: YeiH family protein [Lactococcus]HAP14585.1 putative sulfate exporter family transporter [Lactococcus sp.]HBC91181.1 putative sulfate exporter family transporter [Lactococcus sp.]